MRVEKPKKKSWKKCIAHNDCELLYFGCYDVVSINSKHFDKAKKYYYEELGLNPAILNCAQIIESPYVGEAIPLCFDQKCGAWQHNKCLNPPDCSHTYSENCILEMKYFLSDEIDTYGMGTYNLYALSTEVCKSKCTKVKDEEVAKRKEMVPKIGSQCSFNDNILFKESIKN
jgi:hypothetical protein